jgi:Mn-dependent DtxR family transcriptional regulator
MPIMQGLSADAVVVIQTVRNLGARMGGAVARDRVAALFENDPIALRRAIQELTSRGYVTWRSGALALTEFGAKLFDK